MTASRRAVRGSRGPVGLRQDPYSMAKRIFKGIHPLPQRKLIASCAGPMFKAAQEKGMRKMEAENARKRKNDA